MKVYFEDGSLKENHGIPGINESKNYGLHKCDASEGASFCKVIAGYTASNFPMQVMYSNSLCVLEPEYSWNSRTKEFDLYMRNELGNWVKANTLLKKGFKMHCRSDIVRMYLDGRFAKSV